MNLRLLLSVVLVSFLVSARGQEVAVLSADSSAVDSLIVDKEPLILASSLRCFIDRARTEITLVLKRYAPDMMLHKLPGKYQEALMLHPG